MKRLDNKGFTIIELLIATVTFSVVLLIVTGAIIQFGKIYYKGVIQSRTQERARAISDDISRSLQFGKDYSENPVTPAASGFICAGGRAFTYVTRQQVTTARHGVVASSLSGCIGYTGMNSAAALPNGATELLGERMQLVSLNVDPVGSNSYRVNVRVVYGDNEGFEGNNPANPCRPIVLGGQFCAVSELTTIVTRRL